MAIRVRMWGSVLCCNGLIATSNFVVIFGYLSPVLVEVLSEILLFFREIWINDKIFTRNCKPQNCKPLAMCLFAISSEFLRRILNIFYEVQSVFLVVKFLWILEKVS